VTVPPSSKPDEETVYTAKMVESCLWCDLFT
jgi:hypothetical protein